MRFSEVSKHLKITGVFLFLFEFTHLSVQEAVQHGNNKTLLKREADEMYGSDKSCC